ncbi:carbohydrate ABC transporter ATP-binding protein, CUT1 family [Rhizobiales bacterium GAS113]|nr:carbohydrate ABC transporter ATP-binding protein, CUT1 family [Rhizobiales bacterium GAS113]
MAAIRIDKVVKRYGQHQAVHGVDLEIKDGEFVVLVGPSGCGKSTMLRMIAGLESIDGGEIRIGDRVVNSVEPKDRNIAMVFQNYAIYPHMTVERNIGFGLHTAKLSGEDKRRRILETARLLGLEQLLERKPAELSGGQRQRVAIGRAMVRNPAVFLFDEPLSNLDAQLRAQMRLEIKQLHQRLGTTIVFVTHDQIEAMSMADRIVVIRAGHILQVGAPMELYDRPRDVFTARFIGSPAMNMIDALAGPEGLDFGQDAANLRVPASLQASPAGRKVLLGVRPQELHLVEGDEDYDFMLTGKLRVAEPHGSETFVHLDLARGSVIARAPSDQTFSIGQTLRFGAARKHLRFFDADSEILIRN